MRNVTDFNDNWTFEGASVRLPHTAVELPFSYFDERAYQKPFTYEKRIAFDPAWEGREVSVVFDGAMANAVVSLNGAEILRHADGYTPFGARLTGLMRAGENVLTVVIDGSENPEIPPFGGQIDYLTYAGNYREVWLQVTSPVSISGVKTETPDPLAARKSVRIAAEFANPAVMALTGRLTAELKDANGQVLATVTSAISA